MQEQVLQCRNQYYNVGTILQCSNQYYNAVTSITMQEPV